MHFWASHFIDTNYEAIQWPWNRGSLALSRIQGTHALEFPFLIWVLINTPFVAGGFTSCKGHGTRDVLRPAVSELVFIHYWG